MSPGLFEPSAGHIRRESMPAIDIRVYPRVINYNIYVFYPDNGRKVPDENNSQRIRDVFRGTIDRRNDKYAFRLFGVRISRKNTRRSIYTLRFRRFHVEFRIVPVFSNFPSLRYRRARNMHIYLWRALIIRMKI